MDGGARGETRALLWMNSEEVTWLHHGLGRWLDDAALGALGLAALATFGLLAHTEMDLGGAVARVAFLLGFLGAPFLWAAARVARALGRPRALAVAIDTEGLTLGSGRDARRVRREDLASGLAVPRVCDHVVELALRSGDVVRVAVHDERAADLVLGALRLDAGQRRVAVCSARRLDRVALGYGVFTVASTVGLLASQRLAELVGWERGGVAVLALLVAALASAAALRALGWSELTVGADGVELRRGPWRRFVPYDAIEAVAHGDEAERGAVEVVLRGGRRERLTVDPALRRAVVRRIRRAMARRAEPGAAQQALLARQGRSVGEWRAALRALVKKAAGYREAALTRDEVARLLHDPALSNEQRIAAAMALVEAGDPEAPTRIRVAAEACADPPVRVALEAIEAGGGDGAAVEAALAVARRAGG